MRMIGTVLPTKESLDYTDRWARKRAAEIAKVEKTLRGERRFVQGQNRFYETATRYAVVSEHNLRVLRFEVRADGDYPVK